MIVKIWDKSMHIQGVESTTGHTIQFMFRISLKFPTLEYSMIPHNKPPSSPLASCCYKIFHHQGLFISFGGFQRRYLKVLNRLRFPSCMKTFRRRRAHDLLSTSLRHKMSSRGQTCVTWYKIDSFKNARPHEHAPLYLR